MKSLAIFVLLVLAAGLYMPPFANIGTKARIMYTLSNARQISLMLKNYAGDHNGRYPDGKTSNEVFRELFKTGLLDDERAFTAACSPYEGDNNIGEDPDYAKALEPGENHWSMTKGVTADSPGDVPLLFENPAFATWPPQWNVDAVHRPYSSLYSLLTFSHHDPPPPKIPGRAWSEDKIVVGRNDGSVQAEQLESITGKAVTLERNAEGKNLFEAAGPHEILDIER